jgi:hypothetical protein
MMPYLIGHRTQEMNPDAHRSGPLRHRRSAGVELRRARGIEGRRPVQEPNLDLPVAHLRLEVDLAGLVAVAMQHHVARRLVDGLHEVLGDTLRAAEVRDGVPHECPRGGKVVDVRGHPQPAHLRRRLSRHARQAIRA